jgi:hypothetical protein
VAAPGDSKSAVALSAMARACLAGTGVSYSLLIGRAIHRWLYFQLS